MKKALSVIEKVGKHECQFHRTALSVDHVCRTIMSNNLGELPSTLQWKLLRYLNCFKNYLFFFNVLNFFR